jgi:hypothetical protein
MNPFEEMMPRLVAELHTHSSSLPSSWERLGEVSAKLEQAINASLRGLGYGG